MEIIKILYNTKSGIKELLEMDPHFEKTKNYGIINKTQLTNIRRKLKKFKTTSNAIVHAISTLGVDKHIDSIEKFRAFKDANKSDPIDK